MDEALETLIGVPGGRQPCQLSFRGRGLAAKYDALDAVASVGVIGGAPRTNMAQFVEAVVAQGELVTIDLTTPDGTSRAASGILTNLVPSFGPTGIVQRFDVVFHRCQRLRFTNQSTYLDASAPGS